MPAPVAAHPLVLVGALVVYSVGRLLDAWEVSSVHNRIHVWNLQPAGKAGDWLSSGTEHQRVTRGKDTEP